jgi:hypothetical protein
LYEAGIYDGNGDSLILTNTPSVSYNDASGTSVSVPSDRASVWRTLAFIYNPGPKTVTLVNRGVGTSGAITMLAAPYHDIVGIIGSAAVGGVGGANGFDGVYGDWAAFDSILTTEETLSLRPYLYENYKIIGCLGNSIMQKVTGGDMLGAIQAQCPSNYALEVNWAEGAITTDLLLPKLTTNSFPMLTPSSTGTFFWEFTNSCHNGASLATLQGYVQQFLDWCVTNNQKPITSTILPRSDNSPAANLVATAFNAWILTLNAGFARLVGDIGGIPAMQNTAGANYVDGVHPSDAGCLVIANYFTPLLKNFLL